MQDELERIAALVTEAAGVLDQAARDHQAARDPSAAWRADVLMQVALLRVELLSAADDVLDARALDDAYGAVLRLDELARHLESVPITAAEVLASA
jgi:hypothetical protein